MGLVVFDVDGTLLGAQGQCRPGAQLTIDVVERLGHQVRVWSKAGVGHARTAARLFGLPEECALGKPTGTLSANQALHVLGEMPLLTVDNQKTDIPPGWPGLVVDSWWGCK